MSEAFLLAMLVELNNRMQRALQVLQKAQRHELEDSGEMQKCSFGDWLLFDDVAKAIDILQEGQQ